MVRSSCTGLKETDDPARFLLPVGRADCGDHDQLYGGIILASGVEALEAFSGRPVAWATAQFTRPVVHPTGLELTVHLDHVGGRTTQGRVLASSDGSPAYSVMGAASERVDDAVDHAWVAPPSHLFPVPTGEPTPLVANPERPLHRFDLLASDQRDREQLDGRLDPTGCSGLWLRLRGTRHERAAHLAMLVDVVTLGFFDALGAHVGVATFDNTIRVNALEATDWVLCDVQIESVGGGFGHGRVRLWSTAGNLLATGAQSARLSRVPQAQARAAAVHRGRKTVSLWAGLLGERAMTGPV